MWILGCESLYDSMEFDQESAALFRASDVEIPPDPGSPAQLRLMAWNIKYGGGRIPFWFDCWGDRIQMSSDEVKANMQGIYDLINEADPDILMVEEIEVNSRRSAYTNMVRGILENTKLNYAAYFEVWKSRYIPSEGLGRMNMGNALFSKYPMVSAKRIRHADRTDQDGLTSAFYLHRNIGRVEIEVSEGNLVVAYVIHTEAYDLDGTKQKQISQIHELAMAETLPLVIGGDFNELPPTALRVENFPDERTSAVCGEDFLNPPYTPEVMKPFYDDLKPWIPLEVYGTTSQEQRRYYTHSVLGPEELNESGEAGYWNRTLDYLFVNSGTWIPGTTDVLQEAGQILNGDSVLVSNPLMLSDHAPVFGIWEVTQ